MIPQHHHQHHHQQQHHQEQQCQHLMALLSAALPNDDTATAASTATGISAAVKSSPSSTSTTTSTSASQEVDESNRLSAIESLHQLIRYPPNSVLVSQIATFLAQGFSQLLSDKSYPVQRSAATAYGTLCSVLCSIPIGPNPRQNHVIGRPLVDGFMNWSLPSLNNVIASNRSTELALASLCQFITVGDVGAVDTYAYPILKACQELLEDDRTSPGLLHDLLSVLTAISLKFFRHFHPHFADIVDLLLGWAMLPDLADTDRKVIMGSFLQFKKHWVSNLQFPLSLLLKFLGDIDALLQDGTSGSPQQFQRLLTLLSCFSMVLQSTASGLLELNLLEQIVEPLSKMIVKVLGCLSMIGKKYGWSKWMEDSWRCLTLLAEILGENFARFYESSIDVLFQSLEFDDSARPECGKITSVQIHGVLKTNLQLLSLQKLGLLPSSVHKILQFEAPISQLRLHPNHLVVASSAATYVFLLQHGNDGVVEDSVNCLIEELILLKGMIQEVVAYGGVNISNSSKVPMSKDEFFALIKFDLKVLLSCISVGGCNLVSYPDKDPVFCKRLDKLCILIMSELNPFDLPIQSSVELQVIALEILSRISSVELLTMLSTKGNANVLGNLEKEGDLFMNGNGLNGRRSVIMGEHLRKYNQFVVKSLNSTSPLSIKMKGLDWVCQICVDVMNICKDLDGESIPCEELRHSDIVWALVFSIMDAASDREPKVRSQVSKVFPLLLRARIIGPSHLYHVAEVVLERLGDPDNDIRSEFIMLLSHVLPVTLYLCGLLDSQTARVGGFTFSSCNSDNLHWRNVFALKQLNKVLHPQQLVSIFNYISQRWKVPLSTWINRLICRCQNSKELVLTPLEETCNVSSSSLWARIDVDEDILQKTSSVNTLAGIWWAIHEAARYFISARLRTNLGGPSQTFAALERMLIDISNVVQVDAGEGDGSLSLVSPSGAHLLPMRLLLDFVEVLKKNVYNAYDGSFMLPVVSRQSSLFFRANKKVCEDWFSRICEPMMNAALALHCYDAATHYCALRLQELWNSISCSVKEKPPGHVVDSSSNIRGRLVGDALRIVQHMALVLCRRHEPEALIGLQKWVSSAFSSVYVGEKLALGEHGPLSWIPGLVCQAEGRYEKSAVLFTHLLQSEESLRSMGADGVQFVVARIIECYTAICDWKSLESWLLELQVLRAKHAGKSYSGALTTAGIEMNAIHALAHFDEGDWKASWASLDLTPKSNCEITVDPKLALQRSEQMLLQAMLYQNEGKLERALLEAHKAKSMLDEVLTVLPLHGLVEAAPHAIQLHCIMSLEEGCKFSGNPDTLKESSSFLETFLLEGTYSRMPSYKDCNAWMKILRVYKSVLPTSLGTLQLCKNLMSVACKQTNFQLAKYLHSYLKEHLHSCTEGSYQKFLLASLHYEEILLMYAENKTVDAYVRMWSFIRSGMLCLESVDSTVELDFLKAKACLKLFYWLRQDYLNVTLKEIFSMMYDELNKVDGANGISLMGGLASRPSMHLIAEKIAGAAAKLSTRLCPTLGKSWMSYASWCFNIAKNALAPSQEAGIFLTSLSPIIGSELPPMQLNLTPDEVLGVESMILQLLHKGCSSKYVRVEDEQNLWYQSVDELSNESSAMSMVQKVVDIIESAAGAPGTEDFSNESLSATVANQLRMAFHEHIDAHIEESVLLLSLDGLLEVWWSLRKRKVSLFGYAAFGFMQYLSCSTSKCRSGPSTHSNHGGFCRKSESFTLRAALYILHIILNYGAELKDTLEPHLFTVPLLAWQDIIPQLFARLSSHPEPVIRKLLEGLLMMLAKLSPWSIVYPTLVDVNSYNEEPAEELQRILDGLLKLYPRLVRDVQLMIGELGNVTVLWEELWLSTIQDLHGDVMRRINLLKEEAARIAQNATLNRSEKRTISAAKYSAMMAPIIVALDRRLALISGEPTTPHERWFQEEYKEQLKSAILTFKSPPSSATELGDIWQPFDRIAAALASYQRKCTVKVEDVAPQLAHLSSSDIPMPGLEKQVMLSESDGGLAIPTSSQGIVTISSFSNEVAVLATKTKPKKLVMLGSNGEKYMYLLKGRDDLRLDSRIMQLLQAISNLLHSSTETRRFSVCIRYYSVTPISGRAGLIQWVDNVTSIYSVFKSWQQRVHFAELFATGGGFRKGTVPPPVPRPSDMFYGKIIPALKEKGIRRVISRKDWPHDVKRKVLLELMKETPRQLLHQELWCASESFKSFNSKMKRFSGSLAGMSMIGHILGLGDRHLDNILLDFFTGDIVHIDYNVCFDKGQRLKVPEIVPFRLTQTLEAALGLTGVEGLFRANCEGMIGVLRKNKDILLMLLEVFVWDPLVEWTRGDFHDDAALGGEERRGMELAVSLSLFASRVQEIRVSLQENHDLLLAALPAVESSLERFLDVLNQYQLVSARFFRADQERSTLLLHETSAKSIVADAASKSEKLRALYEIQAHEFSQAKVAVTEKAQEAGTWIEQHGRVLDALRSGSIPDAQVSMNLSGVGDGFSLISAVSVSGVPLTIIPEPTQAKCRNIDREVFQLMSELHHGVSCAENVLQTYSLALQRILPLNYLKTSPMHGWALTFQLASGTLSSDVLSHARRQAGDLITRAHIYNRESNSIRNKHQDLCLKVEEHEVEVEELEKGYTELVTCVGSEAISKARDNLLSSFMKYMQSAGLEPQRQPNVKKEKVLSVLFAAVSLVYDEVKDKLLNILKNLSGAGNNISSLLPNFRGSSSDLELQVEKCVILSESVMELCRLLDNGTTIADKGVVLPMQDLDGNWASYFKAAIGLCKDIVAQMTDSVLPDVIQSIIFFNSVVMDAYGALAHIRGLIKNALDQLVEVEFERASLLELETSYFVKVGLITDQKLALEEAAVKGRDHLSWEEAEELASQEEACRAQLDQLHQSWSQKDMRASVLTKKEASIKRLLVSAELHFRSRLSSQEMKGLQGVRSTALLSALAKPFSDLESIVKTFLAYDIPIHSSSNDAHHLANFLSSGSHIAEYILKFKGLLGGHSFFIWKVGVMDFFLDTVIRHVSLFIDQNLGYDQLVDVLKKKLVLQLRELIGHFLVQDIFPTLLGVLGKETRNLKRHVEVKKEVGFNQVEKGAASAEQVRLMLEEYCNIHETVGAARSAVALVREQVNDIKEAIRITSLEIIQMEWIHNAALTPSYHKRPISQKLFESNDRSAQLLSLNRSKLLDSMRSVVSMLSRSIESLEACERTSLTTEGQLERSMNWACGAPTQSSAGGGSSSSRIPPEFHDHLMTRRQLLKEAREKAADTSNICLAVLEFEVSRDGVLQIPGEIIPSGRDDGAWQQAYLSALTKLDVTFHAFSRAEQDWKLAQSNVQSASSDLYSATNELCIASVKAKSASGDLQSTLLQMRDCAYETSVALSAFNRVAKSHTTLTSECGSMLEEVLAITEDLHDVHNMGKEAASVHYSLTKDLSKGSALLFSLESLLLSDVATMTDAMARERETKVEISPIHGQAIYQSYHPRILEVCQSFKPLVPSLMSSVKEFHSLLIGLAQVASLHAGNLHEALEGLGETTETRSQEINVSRKNLVEIHPEYDNMTGVILSACPGGKDESLRGPSMFSNQEKCWVSPPDTLYSSSSASGSSSGDSNLSNCISCTQALERMSIQADVEDDGECFKTSLFTTDENDDILNMSDLPVMKVKHGTLASNESEVANGDSEAVKLPNDLSDALEDRPKEYSELKLQASNVVSTMMPVESVDGSQQGQLPKKDGSQISRGKNAFATSILRQIEMKLDGRDISRNREITIAEQVDHLLKQAMSIDNLCNMYEGWTPWI